MRIQAPRYAPGTRIAYSNRLIADLETEHRKLLALFTDINSAYMAGDVVRTVANLRKFKGDIQAHLLTEQVRLYVYLQHALASDELSYTLMQGMHREMDVIGKSVLIFLDKYGAQNGKPELAAGFASDLGRLGVVLIERIKREETTLYPLYMPAIELDEVSQVRAVTPAASRRSIQAP
jgi:hypothetical protein